MKKEYAYQHIKNLIFKGHWSHDVPINVNELSSELQMSRTPIHKALTQLEQEGFLKIIPQVGVFVKVPEKKEVVERLYICSNLDALMAEQATMNLQDSDYAKLERILQQMDDPSIPDEEYAMLNKEFHNTINEVSGFTYTLNVAKQLQDYVYYSITPETLFHKERRKRSQEEHWLIYHALRDRDSQLVKELIESHVRSVVDLTKHKVPNEPVNQYALA